MSDQAYYIGLEIGDDLIRTALIDAHGTILDTAARETPHQSAEMLVESAVAVVSELQQKTAANGIPTSVVGASIPAVVNPATKRIEQSYGLVRFTGIDLSAALSSQTQLPVVLEKNANAAAYGEFLCGAAQGSRNVLLVNLGSDISAALIQEGALYRGPLGYAGGFGHMTVNPDGLECECGNIGCLETIASGTNIVRRTQERLFHDRSSSLSSLALPQKGQLTARRIAREAVEGDDFALMMLDRTGKWVGLALANIINLLNLDMVVLAGGVMEAGDLFLRSVINEVRQRALEVPRTHCRIVASALGENAGLIGAALLARDA